MEFLVLVCFYRNNEVQFAGELQPKGCTYRLEVPSGDPKVRPIKVIRAFLN